MAPIRLLVLADAKMLPALAAGLREGGKFDVAPLPLADRDAALAAAQASEAVVIFYGAAGAPLPAALQALAPRLRERGGRMVAVLQRNQAPMRDDCFRAGASDVLFMPLPKEQFVARLAEAIGLAFAPGPSANGPVSLSTRTVSSKVEQASISAAGVDALQDLPLKPGETVRIAWDSFQHWGLVVRGGPTAQVRFAGLATEDEVRIRAWIDGAAKIAVCPAPVAAPPQPAAAAPPPAAPPAPAQGARAAPSSGPPPGFADRKPVRATTRPDHVPSNPAAAPAATASVPGARAAPNAPRAQGNAEPAPSASRTPPARAVGAREGATAKARGDEAAAAPSAEDAPVWPTPVAASLYKDLLMNLLRDEGPPGGLSPAIIGSARKIAGIMSGAERAALSEAGPESAIAEALSARIALDSSTVEGAKLAVRVRTAAVDGDAVTDLTKAADEAAARLQKSANAAIGKGEVEELQLITSVSASLSRDLLNFKEMSDRLQGVGNGPRLGVGTLDPDLVLHGQGARLRPLPSAQPAQQKAELRDFRGLDAKPWRLKPILVSVLVAGAAAAAVYGFYLSVPRRVELTVAHAGEGVSRIEVAGDAAIITVSPDWVARADARMPRLLDVLRAHQVKKAALALPSGGTVGLLDVESGKIYGGPMKSGFEAAPPQSPAPADAAPEPAGGQASGATAPQITPSPQTAPAPQSAPAAQRSPAPQSAPAAQSAPAPQSAPAAQQSARPTPPSSPAAQSAAATR